MNIERRCAIANRLERYRQVTVNGIKFTYRNGLVYANKNIEGFESPMTFDTFEHVYLESLK